MSLDKMDYETERLQQLIRNLPEAQISAALWGQLFAIPERYAQASLAVLWTMLGRTGRLGSVMGLASALVLGVWLGVGEVGQDSMDVFAEVSNWGLL
jgi:hypothetical protein